MSVLDRRTFLNDSARTAAATTAASILATTATT